MQQQQHNAAHAKSVTEGAYHANLSTFIYNSVTFKYKGHGHSCINLHDPGGRSFTVLYIVQMQSKDQPLSQNAIFPAKKEIEGEMQKNNSRSQGHRKSRFSVSRTVVPAHGKGVGTRRS